MKQFVVYEVWTRSRLIEAEDEEHAYDVGSPQVNEDGMNLCNWHVIEIPEAQENQ